MVTVPSAAVGFREVGPLLLHGVRQSLDRRRHLVAERFFVRRAD